MSRFDMREGAVRVAVALYGVLLVAYPESFRSEFGREMIQVFRTACRVSRTHRLPLLWLRCAADLLRSAGAERLQTMRPQLESNPPSLYAATLLLSIVTGYVHLRSDADAVTAVLLLGGAFVCGLACPVRVWRWALLAASGVPLLVLLGHGAVPASFRHHDSDAPFLNPLLPPLVGAYCGALTHHYLPRLRLVFRLSAR